MTEEDVERYKGYYGAEAVDRMLVADLTAMAAEAEKFLEHVLEDFAEVEHPYNGTLGSAADNNLYELRNLQVGMVAPDIAGEDVDGVQFKLSDYKGKVTVIDFWGNW